MSGFHFRDAELISRLALVGISGLSRSGKTLTALRLAHGIVSVTGGKIAAIDTEAGRMLEYGPGAKPYGFAFKYAQMDPPFTGDRYLEILLAAEQIAGENGVIVIDSMSHEHEGDGGVLEQHGEIVAKEGQSATATAWNKAKLGRKKLINYVRSQRRCHLVMCFRGEKKTPVLKNGKFGDPYLDLIGWAGWRFEMSMFIMMDRDKRGFELSHDTTAGLDEILPKGQIGEETGAAIAKWCQSGAGAAPGRATPAPAQTDSPKPAPAADGAKKGVADRMAEKIEAAADVGELGEMDAWIKGEGKGKFSDAEHERLAGLVTAKRTALMPPEEPPEPAADHHAAFAELEDPEWKEAAERAGPDQERMF